MKTVKAFAKMNIDIDEFWNVPEDATEEELKDLLWEICSPEIWVDEVEDTVDDEDVDRVVKRNEYGGIYY